MNSNENRRILEGMLTREELNFVDVEYGYIVQEENGIQCHQRHLLDEFPSTWECARFPYICSDSRGKIALASCISKNGTTETSGIFFQYDGKIFNSEKELFDNGFDCNTQFSLLPLKDYTFIQTNQFSTNIVIKLAPELHTLNNECKEDLFDEMVDSLCRSRNIIPHFSFNPEIINGVAYRYHNFNLINLDKTLEFLDKVQNGLQNTQPTNPPELYSILGFEKVQLNGYPEDGSRYFLPARIFFNQQQSALGFVDYNSSNQETSGLVIIRNFEIISIDENNREVLEDLNIFLDSEHLHHELLF